ncbi:unnamed protein product [Periconia digitata]|uniref:Uncharacterized protein n=1 Tax=Periconia digitata TaxID=1303443 RepID=A0A9W4URJ7_9PLEO|nr:unnamed protein product [Periconia digitata]
MSVWSPSYPFVHLPLSLFQTECYKRSRIAAKKVWQWNNTEYNKPDSCSLIPHQKLLSRIPSLGKPPWPRCNYNSIKKNSDKSLKRITGEIYTHYVHFHRATYF